MENNENKAPENNGAGKKTAVVIALVAVLAVCGVVYSRSKKDEKPAALQETTTAVQDENLTEETTEQAVTEEAVTEEFIVGLSDTELSDSIKTELENINVRILNYISANEKDNSFITEYGFLYNDTTKNNVTVKDLVKAGYIEASEDVQAYTDILYIRASDLAEYADNIDKNDDKLQVFTAYNSKDGYFISNDFYSEGATLEKAQYEELVLSYSFTHGEIHNPKRGDAEFDEIVAATGFGENFDVKHLACDNSYACMVIGSLDDTRVIKEYVLAKQGGKWQVEMKDLDLSEDPRHDVNMKFPKMELGLLPKYTIANYGNIQNGFSKYESALVQLGQINSDEVPATYDCGAGSFAYMEFGEKKFLGHVNEEHKLEFYPVDSLEDAIKYMLGFDDDPPVYILNFHS